MSKFAKLRRACQMHFGLHALVGLLAWTSAAAPNVQGARQPQAVLWKIGQADNGSSEFAFGPSKYEHFISRFGSPDHAYYMGISKPESDWPYLLPGPLDPWAGSGRHVGRWDTMQTLPIGFVLNHAPPEGMCALTIDLCDTDPKRPPGLRVTVNGTIFERELAPGGSVESLKGQLDSAKEQVSRMEFPASLLRAGYNEVALRSTSGGWLIFDALYLEAPAGVRLAAPTRTIIRSVTKANHAVSGTRHTAATVRAEVFRADSPGKLGVQIGEGRVTEWTLEPGLQVLEIPVPASPRGGSTRVRLSADRLLLYEAEFTLTASPPATPADYVDVFAGTAHSRWMIAPGPWMPFGMVKLSPDNQTQGWCAGYEYSHEHIDCFSHIHEWTMGGLGVMPTVGELRTQPGLDGAGYSSRFDKSTERGGIGFYEVLLKDSGIKAELTATTRAGLQRYTYPASEQARVIFDFLLPNEYRIEVVGAQVRRTGPAEIEGTVQTTGGSYFEQDFNLHFVAQFSRPFDCLGGWDGAKRVTNATQLSLAGDCGAWVEFGTRAGEEVLLRTGISLVSVANARLNLEQELGGPFEWDFDAVVNNQRRAWNDLLGRVEIETPDAREKTRFYSNFYRAMSGRNIWSDVNGEWTDPEERRQKLSDPNATMLGCDAFWNTFWNLNQLMNLLAPDWSVRWVNSQLALYDTCGWLAKGPAGLEYIPVMVAEHEIPLLVAAHQHGLKGIDANKMLAAAVKMQTARPQKHPGGGWVGNEHLENYLKYGFVAVDGPTPPQPAKWRKAVCSNTYEYAYDDWCVAQLALALGRKDVAEVFLKRSRNWRNMLDPETRFARPRKASGEWVSPFDPFRTAGFTEGNAWQYTWFVPQDVPGLVEAMGRERFLTRLNEAFEQSALLRFSAPGGQHQLTPINHGNQPGMQLAWLFNWAGSPWLSQKWTGAILGSYYGHNAADAYLGDEDQGQMSTWFVMSALGLFQTDGGCRVNPLYEIGSPLYRKIVLHLSKEHYGGKTFTIEAPNASPMNRYIQAATFNGKTLNRWWIRQKELIQGGQLVLELGPAPNKQWAKGGALPD